MASEKMKEIENSIKREDLENSTIKSVQNIFNEIFKFLFISQDQVDTWVHLKDLLETSPFSNLELISKIIILHELNHFA